jgi:zinc D-Ala-D-Ala carboxypeptidase
MNLSKHVTLKEFTRSDTAIKHGIANHMDSTQLKSAIAVCENIFEPLRAHVGKPIRVNSGFRSFAVNKRIGGSKTSQHMKGEALDLNIQDATTFEWMRKNLDFDQLIYEFGNDAGPQWVHVSYRIDKKHRKQVLRAKKVAGKTVYVPY